MKVESLSAELSAGLRELAWDLWSELGVAAASPLESEQRAVDPEALLLFTLEIGRADPRLLDETLDWLALNESLVSVQRLRNLAQGQGDRALVDAALGWVAQTRSSNRRRAVVANRAPDDLTPLFHGGRSDIGAPDPSFAQQGFARSVLRPSGKSQAPVLDAPIAFAFRLRRMLGLGVRAEVVRTLLTIRAPSVSGSVLAMDAGFAARNVREGILHLQEAGIVTSYTVSGDRRHALATDRWAGLLGLDAPALPFHYDWIPVLRALTVVVRWLGEPGRDDRSDYMLASEARTLLDEIESDLRFAGIPVPRSHARGAAFWDEFVGIVHRALGHARGGDPSRP